MTCYFPLIGRLGNLLFEYAYARAYCERNGYDLCLKPWAGEKIFQIPEAVRSDKPDIVMPEALYQNQESLIYTRKQVREWFKIKPELLELLQPAKCPFDVILNVREGGDYLRAGLVVISRECYLKHALMKGYVDCSIGIETDSNPERLPQFDGDFNASGLGTTWVGLPSFYRLMTAPVLFRANSTFSFWAATLSDGKIYSPVIRGMRGGVPDQYCDNFVEGNYPMMAEAPQNSDLHLPE